MQNNLFYAKQLILKNNLFKTTYFNKQLIQNN